MDVVDSDSFLERTKGGPHGWRGNTTDRRKSEYCFRVYMATLNSWYCSAALNAWRFWQGSRPSNGARICSYSGKITATKSPCEPRQGRHRRCKWRTDSILRVYRQGTCQFPARGSYVAAPGLPAFC